ncbi:MAG: hypothetical protein QOJ57_242 [Thermoleophilaceae bacterium]|nr:hypothetical protein [Thermoleophilaceae bacterium]
MLEPSPPAVHEEPWFADDPTARGDGGSVVSPVPGGDALWSELAADDPVLAEFCRERWLGPYKSLEPAPPTLQATRAALHSVAEHVLSPARQRDNGKIGLRWTLGGFGTPYFGADAQIRVDGGQLVIDAGGEERRHPLSTVRDAAAAVGFDLTGADEAAFDAPLEIDATAARFVGDWFGFVTSVLEQLRAEAPDTWEPSRVQLWPEHFDVALELPELGTTLGGSPGDEAHPEPYLYATLWEAQPPDQLWNARDFPGAELRYAELLAAPDQRAAALDFFRARLAKLNG